MSRKHYIEVAETLMFKRDNPRFDAGKFFDAAVEPHSRPGEFWEE